MYPKGWELWNKFRQFTKVNPHLFPWIYYMDGIYYNVITVVTEHQVIV